MFLDKLLNTPHLHVSRMDHGGEKLEYGTHEITISKKVRELTEEEAEYLIDALRIGREPDPQFGGNPCGCGCGMMARPGREFVQGHDMKLKSRLMKAYKGGCEIAEEELERRGWIK